MVEVKYIKENDLKRIREYLRLKNKLSFLNFINIGVNVGLRISDLAQIKIEDILENRIILKEKKTNKKREIVLNNSCIKAVKELKAFYKNLGYSSEKGFLFKSLAPCYLYKKIDSPITNNGIAKEFFNLRDMLNIPYPIGSHSLRKTWGYHVYNKTLNIGLVMKVFNHSSASQTLRYIGIEQEDIDQVYRDHEI